MSDFDPINDMPSPCNDCGFVHEEAFDTYTGKLMVFVAKTVGELAGNFDDMLSRISDICKGDAHKMTIVLAALACAHIGTSGYPPDIFRCVFNELRKVAVRTSMDETMQQVLRGPRGVA